MTSTISTLAPLAGSAAYTSPSIPVVGAGGVSIVGTVFSDQSGTLSIQQSYDNANFDANNNISVTANQGQGIEISVLAPYFRVVYTNGSTAQTVFRLYIDLVDDEGNFVAPQTPSAGGQFAVLMANSSGGYTYVGRFDGGTGWDACANAATQTGVSGKYAAFDVSTGVVANEVIVQTTQVNAASF